MKLTSLSKAVRTIGAMAMLSVMVGATVEQAAQAQTQNRVPTQWELSCSNWTSSGTFQELQGIEFSPEQEATYQRFFDELNR